MIIPSIDLMDAKAVQLEQGKTKKLERDNVYELAKEFSLYGDIAVIDLDSALGKGDNLSLIKELCKIAPCRVGGGIRTVEKANELLAAGAKKIIIGTCASEQFLKQLPKERVIVAIDTKQGVVVDKGWTNKTQKSPKEKIKELEDYCSEFLFTNVDREGLMQGIDTAIIDELRQCTKNPLTVAGGVTNIKEIVSLERRELNIQIGMALYTGKIKLIDSFCAVLDFKKNNELIPTIVKDDRDQVLMLAFSSEESLRESATKKKATYYSRSRKKLWTKGETSGNTQELLQMRYDCDADTLLFTVKQKNAACHRQIYTCFGDKEFRFDDVYEVIKKRLENPQQGSYTSKLVADEKMIREKIEEESQEVINYKDRDNLVWELADLTYFMYALMVNKGISLDELKNELWRRRK